MCTKSHNRLNIEKMCSTANVSRSGYYAWLSKKENRAERELQDKKDFDNIFKAYSFKSRNKGAKSIKMVLFRQFNIVMNLKKIRRIMKKFGLSCPIRKANLYKMCVWQTNAVHLKMQLAKAPYRGRTNRRTAGGHDFLKFTIDKFRYGRDISEDKVSVDYHHDQIKDQHIFHEPKFFTAVDFRSQSCKYLHLHKPILSIPGAWYPPKNTAYIPPRSDPPPLPRIPLLWRGYFRNTAAGLFSESRYNHTTIR